MTLVLYYSVAFDEATKGKNLANNVVSLALSTKFWAVTNILIYLFDSGQNAFVGFDQISAQTRAAINE